MWHHLIIVVYYIGYIKQWNLAWNGRQGAASRFANFFSFVSIIYWVVRICSLNYSTFAILNFSTDYSIYAMFNIFFIVYLDLHNDLTSGSCSRRRCQKSKRKERRSWKEIRQTWSAQPWIWLWYQRLGRRIYWRPRIFRRCLF